VVSIIDIHAALQMGVALVDPIPWKWRGSRVSQLPNCFSSVGLKEAQVRHGVGARGPNWGRSPGWLNDVRGRIATKHPCHRIFLKALSLREIVGEI
jgi:hypothetical protein